MIYMVYGSFLNTHTLYDSGALWFRWFRFSDLSQNEFLDIISTYVRTVLFRLCFIKKSINNTRTNLDKRARYVPTLSTEHTLRTARLLISASTPVSSKPILPPTWSTLSADSGSLWVRSPAKPHGSLSQRPTWTESAPIWADLEHAGRWLMELGGGAQPRQTGKFLKSAPSVVQVSAQRGPRQRPAWSKSAPRWISKIVMRKSMKLI